MIKKIVIILVCWWIAVSVMLSCMASLDAGFFDEDRNPHRAPFLVVQVLDVHLGDDGRGYDQFGYYVFSRRDAVVFLVFNPFNNCCDDIIARFDF